MEAVPRIWKCHIEDVEVLGRTILIHGFVFLNHRPEICFWTKPQM